MRVGIPSRRDGASDIGRVDPDGARPGEGPLDGAGRPIGSAQDARPRSAARGQSTLELALVLPLFLVLMTGLVEFGLAFHAVLSINRASQNGATVAGQVGSTPGGDCLILQRIEQDVGVPIDKNRIRSVQVQRTSPSGTNAFEANIYDRAGSLTCNLADGRTITVPYTATSTAYPANQRCAVLLGCPSLGVGRDHVDTVAVQIRYQHVWITPLGELMPLIGGGGFERSTWTFNKRNAVRMEPEA